MNKKEEINSGYQAEDWWKAILKTAQQELAPEMGVAYQEVVLFCLQGFDKKERGIDRQDIEERNSRDRYYVDEDYEEVGIEKEFFWRALEPLESFGF